MHSLVSISRPILRLTQRLVLCCIASNVYAVSTSTQSEQGWDFNLPAPALQSLCQQTLQTANTRFQALEQSETDTSLSSVFTPYEAMQLDLQVINHVSYLKAVHPDATIRAAAEQCSQDYSDFETAVGLSRPFYEKIAAVETTGLSEVDRYMIERFLRDYRKSGVDRDAKTRAKVQALKSEITELGNLFGKTIREDTRYVEVAASRLEGLPDDYIESHPPNANNQVRISTDYPDYFPVMKYAKDDALRREMYVAKNTIGSPQNSSTLKQLINRRHELVQHLGYPTYAAYAMDGLMIETPANAQSFLDEVGKALQKPAQAELQNLTRRLKAENPDAQRMQFWQRSYIANLIREEDYALNAREVRQYFDFNKVQAGIFALTESLFGVEIVPWKTTTWDDSVSTWELRENNKVIGRFYMDLHPRDDKFKHAAHWTLQRGIKNQQIPISGLATNFPRGLMEHSQVETFLHEFGHLLHNMFSGTQQYLEITGMTMERDFVEAPSQMLVEWVWDYATLSSFATNAAGEPIPKSLVEKMNAARYFGVATGTATQIFYAQLSLNYYNREPDSFELLPLLQEVQSRYSPYPYVADTHFYNNFGHLNGYASNYYMYQWSLAIATDLFSRFEESGLRNTVVANDYRQQVLGAAGSKPARAFTADFLGRPMTIDAYITFLQQLKP